MLGKGGDLPSLVNPLVLVSLGLSHYNMISSDRPVFPALGLEWGALAAYVMRADEEEAGVLAYSKPIFPLFLWLGPSTPSLLCLFYLLQRNFQSSAEVEEAQLPLSLE